MHALGAVVIVAVVLVNVEVGIGVVVFPPKYLGLVVSSQYLVELETVVEVFVGEAAEVDSASEDLVEIEVAAVEVLVDATEVDLASAIIFANVSCACTCRSLFIPACLLMGGTLSRLPCKLR